MVRVIVRACVNFAGRAERAPVRWVAIGRTENHKRSAPGLDRRPRADHSEVAPTLPHDAVLDAELVVSDLARIERVERVGNWYA